MKSKEEIIHDMCMTYRHDYGLDRDPSDPPWIAGMTPIERKGLYNTMEQIYDHHIAQIVESYENLNNGSSVVLPVDKEHDIYAKAEKYAEDEDERTSAAATAWQFSVLAHELKNKFGVN